MVYFVQKKSEVFWCLPRYLATVENYIGNEIKVLRPENGGEYRYTCRPILWNNLTIFAANEEFRVFTCRNGTPQHNGVAERRNRTLVEMLRTWMSLKCSQNLWGELLYTDSYLQIRIPNVSHRCWIQSILAYSDFHATKVWCKIKGGIVVGYANQHKRSYRKYFAHFFYIK